MKKLTIIFALLIFGLSAQIVSGQNEKEMVIKTARALEEKPLDKETIKMREQSFKYLVQTDQVHLNICTNLTSPYSDKKNKFGGEFLLAYTIGMGAFKLENPDKAADENAAQLAGLESALKSYEAIIKEKPKGKFDAVEELILKRNDGTLAKYVAAVDCSK